MDQGTGRGDEPSSWQVAEALSSNIRDISRRAEIDSLLFIAAIIGFLIVRGTGASSLSILGLQITDFKTVQFALPPLAAFLALRYAKAERLSASIGMQLRDLLHEDLPSVPITVSPPDWDIVRDVAVRIRSVSRFSSIGISAAMFGFVVAGVVVNLLDAKGSSIPWVVISSLVSALTIFIMFLTRPVWSGAVVARSARD
jgi:hypothetical protein